MQHARLLGHCQGILQAVKGVEKGDVCSPSPASTMVRGRSKALTDNPREVASPKGIPNLQTPPHRHGGPRAYDMHIEPAAFAVMRMNIRQQQQQQADQRLSLSSEQRAESREQ